MSSSGSTLSLKMGRKESQLEDWASEHIRKGMFGQELGLPSSPPGLSSLEHEMAKTVCHLKDRHRCSTKVPKTMQCA